METLLEKARSVQGYFRLDEYGNGAGSVAAAVLTEDGNIYTGICIDLACGIGFCAEHSAIAEMLKNRETRIAMVVACNSEGILPPCGRCREMMMQINPGNAETDVMIGVGKTVKLKELLPHHWY